MILAGPAEYDITLIRDIRDLSNRIHTALHRRKNEAIMTDKGLAARIHCHCHCQARGTSEDNNNNNNLYLYSLLLKKEKKIILKYSAFISGK